MNLDQLSRDTVIRRHSECEGSISINSEPRPNVDIENMSYLYGPISILNTFAYVIWVWHSFMYRDIRYYTHQTASPCSSKPSVSFSFNSVIHHCILTESQHITLRSLKWRVFLRYGFGYKQQVSAQATNAPFFWSCRRNCFAISNVASQSEIRGARCYKALHSPNFKTKSSD